MWPPKLLHKCALRASFELPIGRMLTTKHALSVAKRSSDEKQWVHLTHEAPEVQRLHAMRGSQHRKHTN